MKSKYVLTGNRDYDLFLTKEDMGSDHWELLMGCYHSGECKEDAEFAANYFTLEDENAAKAYLEDSGLEIENENIMSYYLWILSGDIQELDI